MAMAAGQKRGFTRSLSLNMGMMCGMGLIGIFTALCASWLQNSPSFLLAMKIIGSAYLLHLAYHVWRSTPDDSSDNNFSFHTGLLLQLTNVKVYLYFITGLGAFKLAGALSSLSLKWLLMVAICSLGTFAWTASGQLINRFYHRHYKGLNVIVALLLVFSAVDLWR